MQRQAKKQMNEKAKLSLKRIAKIILATGVIIALIHFVHAVTLDRIIEYREVSFSSPNVPAEMSGYRIAFVADTHDLPSESLTEIVDELSNRQIDLLVLGGDYLSFRYAPHHIMEILSQTATTDGIFGVEGNHDDYVEVFAAMDAHGITPLSNSGLHVRNGFFLAGVEDLNNRNPNIARATENSNFGDFVLLISHHPDISIISLEVYFHKVHGSDIFHSHSGDYAFPLP